MKAYVKRKCGKCQHWSGFPHVHCLLESPIINFTSIKNGRKVFESVPANKQNCKKKRQEFLDNENRNSQ